MQNKSLEEQSFENAVWFHAPELRRIMRGVSPTRVLTSYRRASLVKWGVLKSGRDRKRNSTVVSDKAQRVLEELKE